MRIVAGPPLADLQLQLKTRIDAEAEAIRLEYITPGEGQIMAYQQKAAEAERYLVEPDIDEMLIPHIVAEVGITGPTKYHVAQVVLGMRDVWAQISAVLERERITAKNAVDAAETPTEAHAAARVSWPRL